MTHPFFSKTSLSALFFLALAACGDEAKTDTATDTAAQATGNPELVALTERIKKDPKNDSLHFRRALVFYELEGYDEAIADLRSAITIDSMQPQYYELLADVFLDYTKSIQAVRTMETAAWKFPERPATLLKMGEVYLIVKRHGEALKTLDRVLQRDPQNAEAYFLTGRVALDMGDSKRAIAALKKSVQLDADNPEAWVMLGRIFADEGNPIALQYYDNALRLDTTDNEVRVFKGMFYKQRGDTKKAFEIYRDIVVRDPDYSDAYFDMGMIYLELDSLSKAYDHFNLALRTDPLFVKAYYYRGVTAEAQGNTAAALKDYEQANKMSPNYPEAKAAVERLKK